MSEKILLRQAPPNRLLPFSLSLGLILILVLMLYQLDLTPPFWWDEGWTMMLARNWAQDGFYGQINDGVRQSPGLAAAFPVVAPVALAFRILGAGVWQGRLPGVLFTLGALALFLNLASRLYDRRTAWAALGLVLLLPLNDKLHPILIGRQALGEMPALFWLLAGFGLFLSALQQRGMTALAAGLGAACAWGVALITKAQIPPALAAAIAAGMLACLLARRWDLLAKTSLAGLGAWLARWGLLRLQAALLVDRSLPGQPLEGYLSMSAVVPALHVRLVAWTVALAFGLGLTLALVSAAWHWMHEGREVFQERLPQAELPNWILRAALLGFLVSWYGWYLLLAMYWPRYLFPVLFLGAIFEADLLKRWTLNFDLPDSVRAAASVLKREREPDRWRALIGILLFAQKMTVFLLVAVITLPILSGGAVYQAAAYLNENTPGGSQVESYEAQLNFLLEMPFRYPPDTLHVAFNKRTLIDPTIQVEYSPDWQAVDYLVVGPSAKDWRVYEPVLSSGAFEWVVTYGSYDIYERKH